GRGGCLPASTAPRKPAFPPKPEKELPHLLQKRRWTTRPRRQKREWRRRGQRTILSQRATDASSAQCPAGDPGLWSLWSRLRVGMRVSVGGLRVAEFDQAEVVYPKLAADQWSGRLARSEEHTSELQSPYDLVCRLLL